MQAPLSYVASAENPLDGGWAVSGAHPELPGGYVQTIGTLESFLGLNRAQ